MLAPKPIFAFLLAFALFSSYAFSASLTYKSPLASVESLLNKTGMEQISSLFGEGNPMKDLDVQEALGALAKAGANLSNLSNLSDLSNYSSGKPSLPNVAAMPKPPSIAIPAFQLRLIGAIAIFLFYIFAAGKIADFFESSRIKLSKREALLAPFAMLFVSLVAIAFYFLSGAYRPPQDTLITNIVFLALIPAGIALVIGSFVLYSFFKDRLTYPQSLDLSIRIVLSPVFDGFKGYWIALGAGVILSIISTVSFYSSGGRLSLATFDFLLLSILASLYYAYQFFASRTSEERAGNVVTILCLLAPSIVQRYLKDAACSILVRLPFHIFPSCPLDSAGSEVTFAMSLGVTMLLLVPVVPIIYSFAVNLLRLWALVELLLKPEASGTQGLLRGYESQSYEGLGDEERKRIADAVAKAKEEERLKRQMKGKEGL
jgi:hypothetical protein